MASFSTIITTNTLASTISEIQADETYWSISFVTSVTTRAVNVTVGYTTNAISLTGTAQVDTFVEGEVVNTIRLNYNDGGADIIVDEQTGINETFTYGGSYIIEDYTITFVAG